MKWYSLVLIGLTESTIRKILQNFHNFEDLKVENHELLDKLNLKESEKEKLKLLKNINTDYEIEKLRKKGVFVVCIKDEAYPASLRNIASPPNFLYCCGNIELLKEENKIAVVGNRDCSNYGERVTKIFVEELVKEDFTIVSGLAKGIDTVAHKVTLECSGKAIGVVGSGLDIVYPKENYELWENIKRKGLLISEYPLGTAVEKYHFPMRNRIIVGLSKGILVSESKNKGGSLITANLAFEENRDIFAVPQDVFSEYSGCNTLIKESIAKLVTTPSDILEEYLSMKSSKRDLPISKEEEKILQLINKSKNLDEITDITKFSPSMALTILLNLELKGLVKSLPGGMYKSTNKN